MKLNELSYELKAKARQCESTDELVALAQKEGVELDLDQLDQVSGGWEDNEDNCSRDNGYYG